MVRFFENIPVNTEDDLNLPDSIFMMTDTIVIFDNVSQKIKVVSNAYTEGVGVKSAYNEATAKVDKIIDRLRKQISIPENKTKSKGKKEIKSNFTKEDFKAIVEKGKQYIKEGDIFQVVLSQRFEIETEEEPVQVYRAIRSLNPSPYMFLVNLGGMSLVGASPEVLVRVEDDEITLRPIAGTRKRGETEEEDRALEKDLLADPKERAEHIMLVDLGRNDVGRVSETGTVKVDELMLIERYSHVMHIVSNVKGTLKKGMDSFDVLRACFPAGTVSGAPKVRAMEIIEELEPARRGPYAGAIGYFYYTGNIEKPLTFNWLSLRSMQSLDLSFFCLLRQGRFCKKM